MNRVRLTEMVRLLEGVASNTAILQKAEGKIMPIPTNFEMMVFVDSSDCGTVACAWGYAAFHPPFIAQGVTLSGWAPSYGGFYGFDAAALFFGLPKSDIEYLFGPANYADELDITPQDVIKRIQELLTQSESPEASNG